MINLFIKINKKLIKNLILKNPKAISLKFIKGLIIIEVNEDDLKSKEKKLEKKVE